MRTKIVRSADTLCAQTGSLLSGELGRRAGRSAYLELRDSVLDIGSVEAYAQLVPNVMFLIKTARPRGHRKNRDDDLLSRLRRKGGRIESTSMSITN